MVSTKNGHEDIVRHLVDNGSDPHHQKEVNSIGAGSRGGGAQPQIFLERWHTELEVITCIHVVCN